jgi:hypothetical protein
MIKREVSSLKPQIELLLMNIQREGMENLVYFLKNSDYYSAPASSSYHCSFPGGLAFHCCSVLNVLSSRISTLGEGVMNKWVEDSIVICSLLHDLCKIDFYKRVGATYSIEDKFPYGHGEKSVLIAQKYIPLTDFEVMAIRWHMGIPESYADKMSYNAALKIEPSILYLHLADYESSIIQEPIEMGRMKSIGNKLR